MMRVCLVTIGPSWRVGSISISTWNFLRPEFSLLISVGHWRRFYLQGRASRSQTWRSMTVKRPQCMMSTWRRKWGESSNKGSKRHTMRTMMTSHQCPESSAPSSKANLGFAPLSFAACLRRVVGEVSLRGLISLVISWLIVPVIFLLVFYSLMNDRIWLFSYTQKIWMRIRLYY